MLCFCNISTCQMHGNKCVESKVSINCDANMPACKKEDLWIIRHLTNAGLKALTIVICNYYTVPEIHFDNNCYKRSMISNQIYHKMLNYFKWHTDGLDWLYYTIVRLKGADAMDMWSWLTCTDTDTVSPGSALCGQTYLSQYSEFISNKKESDCFFFSSNYYWNITP